MIRLSLQYVRPGMLLGRDICSANGQVILAAGVRLNEKYLELLRQWEITSVYISNPDIELPITKEMISPQLKASTVRAVKNAFAAVVDDGFFQLTDEDKQLINNIVRQVVKEKAAMLSLAQISRHQRDLFTHSVNVAVLSLMTAVSLGYRAEEDLSRLAVGALLHDIGKVFVSPAVLEKREPLTEEEAELVRSHTVSGFEILRRTADFSLVAAHIAYQHHEHHDGTGYPRGIAGEDISMFGRIVAIANAYDELVTGRPAQKALEAHAAYEHILAGVGSLFETVVAKAFLAKIAVYPIGTMVRLTTGQTGVVAGVTSLLQHRPEIRVLTDEHGQRLTAPYLVNLADKDNLTVFVDRVLSDREKLAVLGWEG
jgi:putative nucleotidyltransferase with HDIG domain